MKKITLLIVLLTSAFGFSQNLITNGDFESGTAGWSGNQAAAGNIVTVSGNSYFSHNVAAAGNPWDANLSYVLNIPTAGVNYKLTFTAWSTANRVLTAGIGLNQDPWTNVNQNVNLTSTQQTFVLNFTSNFASPTSRIIFDMGQATGFVNIDNVMLEIVNITQPLDLLLGFETSETGGVDGGPFGNGPAPVLEAGTGTNTTQVLKIVGNPTGEPWQGINLNLTSPTNLTTSQTMTMDVFSDAPITFLVKVTGGVGGPATVAAAATHTGGSTWQTVSFTFNTALDGQGALASGTYNKFVIHTYWAPGATAFFNPTIPTPARTFYVDNIRGPLGTPPVIPTPTTPAPVPAMPNAQVYSIYNDTNSYTTNFPVTYSFGTLSAEPDLDPSSTVNKAYRFNFGIAGWGQGEAMANVTSYGFVSFDYWAQPNLPNGFRFVMISNNGGVTEHVYQIGTNEALVTGQWKKVEIPMSYFTGIGFASTNFFQWKVSPFNDSVDNAGYVYVDNILLTTTSILSNETFTTSQIKMYPNPSTGIVTIDSKDVVDSIAVINVLGQTVMSKEINSASFTLDISDLNAGQYFIQLNSNNNKVVKKLFKN